MSRFIAASLALALAIGFAGTSIAKPGYKKDLGQKCDFCHAEGKEKKEANPDNKHWKAAKDMAKKHAGKKCGECHKGSTKPEKK